MLRIFNHYVPKSLVILGLIEVLVLLFSIEVAVRLRFYSIDVQIGPWVDRLPEAFAFTAVVYIAMLAVGMYQQDCCRDLRMTFVRILAAFGGAMALMALLFYITPLLLIWRSVAVIALFVAAVGIMITRAVFQHFADMTLFKRRVVVLGAGQRATKVKNLEEGEVSPGFHIIHYVRMQNKEQEIARAVPRQDIQSLFHFVEENQIEELVLASEERRGTLPIAQLIECKLRGTRITDLNLFLERETGRIELDGLQPSWIIFSDGFKFTDQANAIAKRVFDVFVSFALLIMAFPLFIFAAAGVKLTSQGPVFYRQERIGRYGLGYKVIKFRSMTTDAEVKSGPAWATENDPRITAFGRFIRAARIDELPQIFNVLRGDMSFVGPRPERPVFVEELTKDIPFYAERHAVKPGITGWAQINYPYGASIKDARHKLEYDLYYVKNFSVFLDLIILIQTVRVVLWQDGVR